MKCCIVQHFIWVFTVKVPCFNISCIQRVDRQRSGSVVECLTLDREAASWSLTGVNALCPRARHIDPSLVLVQPRKICPYITERFLMGCKESNKQNKGLIKGEINK